MVQDGIRPVRIGVGHVRETDAGRSGEPDRLLARLLLQGLELHQPLDGGGGVDESGDLPGQFDDRALDLADQLQEGGHHAVGHDAVADADHAPEEGGGVAAHEAEVHEGAGHGVVAQAEDGLVIDVALQPAQAVHDALRADQGQDDDAFLEALLHQLLDLRVLLADPFGEPAERPEEQAGPQDGGDHQDHQDPEQVGGHQQQVHRSGDELHQGDDHVGEAGAQQVGDHAHVLFEPVDGIAAAEALAAAPGAAEHGGEGLGAQVVAGLDEVVALPGRSAHRADQLQQHDAEEDADVQPEGCVADARGDVHQAFANPDESERCGDPHQPDDDAEQRPPAGRTRHGAQAPEDLPDRNHSASRPALRQVSVRVPTSVRACSSVTS